MSSEEDGLAPDTQKRLIRADEIVEAMVKNIEERYKAHHFLSPCSTDPLIIDGILESLRKKGYEAVHNAAYNNIYISSYKYAHQRCAHCRAMCTTEDYNAHFPWKCSKFVKKVQDLFDQLINKGRIDSTLDKFQEIVVLKELCKIYGIQTQQRGHALCLKSANLSRFHS